MLICLFADNELCTQNKLANWDFPVSLADRAGSEPVLAGFPGVPTESQDSCKQGVRGGGGQGLLT